MRWQRRLYVYARANGGLPIVAREECSVAPFCGLFYQKRETFASSIAPCKLGSNTAYYNGVLQAYPWGSALPKGTEIGKMVRQTLGGRSDADSKRAKMPATWATDASPLRRHRIACVGDSLTRGDGSHLAGPISKRISKFGNYPGKLQLALGNNGMPGWQVSNHGRGGATAIASGQNRACLGPTLTGGTLGYSATKEFREALRVRPNVVLMMLGTNDSPAACWDAVQFALDLKDLVRSFWRLPSRPAVVVMAPPAPQNDTAALQGFGVRGPLMRDEMPRLLRRLVASLGGTVDSHADSTMVCDPATVHFLDLQRAYWQQGCDDVVSQQCRRLYAADRLHTSAAGAGVIVDAVVQLLRKSPSCKQRHGAVQKRL